jgi:hypothetical protein
MTERGGYHFTVKEKARGEFWIAVEPAGATLERSRSPRPRPEHSRRFN